MLRIYNVSKKFNNMYVLRDLSMMLDQGSIVVLLGPSGVGKSTFLRILNHLESADSGSVFYEGSLVDFETIHKKHLSGMVFQNFGLFKHLTTCENLTIIGQKVLGYSAQKANELAKRLLEQFGLTAQADLPVTRLSGGQQQRLALARAVAPGPKILCMDEPTSALDPLLTKFVASLIKDLAAAGYGIIITTHDMSLVENLGACTLYLMNEGQFVEVASSTKIASHPEKYPKIVQFMRGEKEI